MGGTTTTTIIAIRVKIDISRVTGTIHHSKASDDTHTRVSDPSNSRLMLAGISAGLTGGKPKSQKS
jgi:hypothetical protein